MRTACLVVRGIIADAAIAVVLPLLLLEDFLLLALVTCQMTIPSSATIRTATMLIMTMTAVSVDDAGAVPALKLLSKLLPSIVECACFTERGYKKLVVYW